MTPRIQPVDVEDLTDTEYKVLENRLRRAAQRQGLRLQKCRARDPRHLLFGTYQLVDVATNCLTYGAWGSQRGFGLDIIDVMHYLNHEEEK